AHVLALDSGERARTRAGLLLRGRVSVRWVDAEPDQAARAAGRLARRVHLLRQRGILLGRGVVLVGPLWALAACAGLARRARADRRGGARRRARSSRFAHDARARRIALRVGAVPQLLLELVGLLLRDDVAPGLSRRATRLRGRHAGVVRRIAAP